MCETSPLLASILPLAHPVSIRSQPHTFSLLECQILCVRNGLFRVRETPLELGFGIAFSPRCEGEMARDFCKIRPWLEFTPFGPNLDLLDWKQTEE